MRSISRDIHASSTCNDLAGKLNTNGSFYGPLSSLNSRLNISLDNPQINGIRLREKWKGTFVGYPIHSEERKPYCIRFIEYPYGNHIWIHAYNYFYQITFPFLKQVRNFEKTTLVKLLCKQEDIPTELEIIIINFCF